MNAFFECRIIFVNTFPVQGTNFQKINKYTYKNYFDFILFLGDQKMAGYFIVIFFGFVKKCCWSKNEKTALKKTISHNQRF